MKNKCGECKYHKNMRCNLPQKTFIIVPETEACRHFTQKPKMTNGDKIRQMSDGVLAYAMTRLILEGCPISGAKTIEDMKACKISTDCVACLKQLLNQEVKDE